MLVLRVRNNHVRIPIPELRVFRNAELKIVDPETNASLPRNQRGELCIRGDQIMKGYPNDNKATKRTIIDKWLHTGDIGYINGDDGLFIIDRLSIKGFKLLHLSLKRCFLRALNYQTWQLSRRMIDEGAWEVPVAFVIKSKGSNVTEAEINSFISKQVRVLHVPSRYQYADIFTKELPSALFEEFQSNLSVRPPPTPTTEAY
ncbi:4-coumarate--CoA ligase 2 [Tanacetum coccineum]